MTAPLDPIQTAADETISSWPGVRTKQVFGHHGYVRAKKMFAFIAPGGLAFKAAAKIAEPLYASGAAVPFVYGPSMEMRGWPVLPLVDDTSLTRALSAAREAFESVG